MKEVHIVRNQAHVGRKGKGRPDWGSNPKFPKSSKGGIVATLPKVEGSSIPSTTAFKGEMLHALYVKECCNSAILWSGIFSVFLIFHYNCIYVQPPFPVLLESNSPVCLASVISNILGFKIFTRADTS